MNYSFLIYIGMACALCISAVGSGFGAGMASLASVGGWKKCYANGKQDPFILVLLVHLLHRSSMASFL